MATQLREDKSLKIAETCYWILRPERDVWVTGGVSSLMLQIDNLKGGFIFLYEGSERHNITESVIQQGLNFVEGSPLSLPIDNDVVLLFQRRSKNIEAQFLVTAWIDGR